MAMPEPPEGAIEVPVVWVGVDDLPVQFVNQFLGVIEQNEIFLNFGSLVPPPIMGETIENGGLRPRASSSFRSGRWPGWR